MAVLPRAEPRVRWRPLTRGAMLTMATSGQDPGSGGEIALMLEQRIDRERGIGGLGLEGGRIRREDIEQVPPLKVGGGADPRVELARAPPVGDIPTPPHTGPAIGLQQLAPVGVGVEHIPRPTTS